MSDGSTHLLRQANLATFMLWDFAEAEAEHHPVFMDNINHLHLMHHIEPKKLGLAYNKAIHAVTFMSKEMGQILTKIVVHDGWQALKDWIGEPFAENCIPDLVYEHMLITGYIQQEVSATNPAQAVITDARKMTVEPGLDCPYCGQWMPQDTTFCASCHRSSGSLQSTVLDRIAKLTNNPIYRDPTVPLNVEVIVQETVLCRWHLVSQRHKEAQQHITEEITN